MERQGGQPLELSKSGLRGSRRGWEHPCFSIHTFVAAQAYNLLCHLSFASASCVRSVWPPNRSQMSTTSVISIEVSEFFSE
jgi:hypothetical protein